MTTGRRGFILLWLSGLVAGCSSTTGNRFEEESAQRHISIARALESQSHWTDAALEYAIVAQMYPGSENFGEAVRKAALLFARSDDESVNDSTVLHWFREYENLPLPEEEQALVRTHIATLQALTGMKSRLKAQEARTDSIVSAQGQQQADILARENRVKDLEAQLQRELAKTREELQKLREIDMKVGRAKDEGK